jgi:WD40 repeat protein
MLAVGSDDGGVLVSDARTGLPVRTLQGHRGRVFSVSYGENALVTGGPATAPCASGTPAAASTCTR